MSIVSTTTSNNRPLTSFVVFAYNQEKFIADAIKAAFSQTYSPLEIIISDDCSTDRTYDTVCQLVDSYDGPHVVRLNRNDCNLGVAAHFSKLIAMAKGDNIIVAAGDDISLPNRTSDAVHELSKDSRISFVECAEIEFSAAHPMIDASDHIPVTRTFDLHDYMTGKAPKLTGSGRAFRKAAFTKFGDLRKECPTEDTPCVLRFLLSGLGAKHSNVGTFRRRHENNLSSGSSLRRMNLKNILVQYTQDVQRACEEGWVDLQTKTLVLDWANREIGRRIDMQTFANDPSRIRAECRLALSKHLPLKQKLSRIIQGISKRIRKRFSVST